MPIQFHPKPGTILICDFNTGFQPPEMVKRRPVVVVSPQMSQRARLCTVVAISTEPPRIALPYHHELDICLPKPWDEGPNWVKGDMVYSVAFDRLELIRSGLRDANGRRIYEIVQLSAVNLKKVRECVLCGLGLASLTIHLT